MNLDLYFFDLINRFAKKQAWLDYLAIFLAKYLAYVLIAVLFFSAYINKNLGIFLVPISSGIFSRFVVNELVYLFYKRKRPSEALGITPLIKKPKYPAFPSGHTSFFFALSFAILPYSISAGVVFIIFSFLISFSRIFAGIHWPSDILAGIAAGAVSAIIIYYFLFSWMLFSL